MKIKKNDKVIVISGKDKGKTGVVQKVFPKKNKIIVENINVHKRYRKKKSRKQQNNKNNNILEIFSPIDASNVRIIDPNTKKPCKISYIKKDGKKIRVNKETKENL